MQSLRNIREYCSLRSEFFIRIAVFPFLAGRTAPARAQSERRAAAETRGDAEERIKTRIAMPKIGFNGNF